MSDYIPEEVLKWLPAKTLLRFRCVCKWWKEIIDSPLFVQQHLALQNSRLILKCEESDLLVLDPCTLPSVETLSLPSPFLDTLSDPIEDDGPEPFRLVGTLHGIVCLYDNFDNFLIWNPSIRKFSNIPVPALDFDWDDDDVEDLFYFGFWIDPSDKHFKIIVFKLVYDDDPYGLVDGILYSSIHQEWESVPLDVLKDLRPYAESPPVMIDGVAYWRANYEYTDEEGKEFLNIVILSFDFASECFDTIKVPDSTHYNGRFHPTLCSLQDTLALVSWELGESDRCDVHIWAEVIWINVMAFDLALAPVFRVLWVLGETERTCRVIAETCEDLVLYDTQLNYDVLKSGLRNSASIYMAYDFIESLLFP